MGNTVNCLIEKSNEGYTIYENMDNPETLSIREVEDLSPEQRTQYLIDESVMEILKLKDMVECGCFKNVVGDIQVEPNGLTIKLNFERHED